MGIYNLLYVGTHHFLRFVATSRSGLISIKVELPDERCSVPFTANKVWHKWVQTVMTSFPTLVLQLILTQV